MSWADRKRQAAEEGLAAPTAVIDLGLELLETIRTPGVCYTQVEIAEVSGCSRGLIYAIEQRALAKLRRRVAARPELAEALRLLLRQRAQRRGEGRLVS